MDQLQEKMFLLSIPYGLMVLNSIIVYYNVCFEYSVYIAIGLRFLLLINKLALAISKT